MKLPSPGTAIAGLALASVLGGSAYAGLAIPRNSVTTAQVKDHSLLAKDFKRGQLPRGPAGAMGEVGPSGPAGPPGPAATATTTYDRVDLGLATVNGSTTDERIITCPNGGTALNGGIYGTSAVVEQSHPSWRNAPTDASDWYLFVRGNSTVFGYHPWIVCVR